ncbi:hypothetical protein G6F22_017537 [Rhizopus arrhizus]|nr:hypothetical protein G6F22_017537 [Rhizopus arrhizus]
MAVRALLEDGRCRIARLPGDVAPAACFRGRPQGACAGALRGGPEGGAGGCQAADALWRDLAACRAIQGSGGAACAGYRSGARAGADAGPVCTRAALYAAVRRCRRPDDEAGREIPRQAALAASGHWCAVAGGPQAGGRSAV